MVIERRRQRRIRVRLPMRLSYEDVQIPANSENISLLGAYVEAEQEIPLGKKLDIVMEIPDYANNSSLAGQIKCRGDVFRCALSKMIESKRIYGLGIFFTAFSDGQDRDKLAKYIDYLILEEEEKIKKATKLWEEKRKRKFQNQ